ncbi:MAG TPA: SPOR domain-containing protein [Nitrospirota bacterium]
MKDIGRIKERYDFSFDARQLGLLLLGAVGIIALVFTLGISLGMQWERKKSGAGDSIAQVKVSPAAVPAPVPAAIAPPVLKPVTTVAAATVSETKPADANAKEDAKLKAAENAKLTFPKTLTAKGDKAAPLTKEKPKDPKDKATQAASGKYTVQAGAYKEKGTARARADKLTAKGFEARVLTDNKKGQPVYKIHVGSFDTKENAQAMAKKLKAVEKNVFVTTE